MLIVIAAISQSYISQWLAQPQDISGQKKKAMYTWFITEKRRSIGMSNGKFRFPFCTRFFFILLPLSLSCALQLDSLNSGMSTTRHGICFGH